MDLGMPTLLETKSLEECASLCRELGLQFIELNMNLPQYQPWHIDADYFLKIAQKYHIYYTVHLDENLNPCDLNPLVAKAYLETAMQGIAAARRLKAPVVNMHLANGVFFVMPHGKVYLYNTYLDDYLQSLRSFRDDCVEAMAGSDMTLCVENTDGFYQPFALRALDLLLTSERFALTLDLGHSFVEGGNGEKVILTRKSRLRHMHAHDAVGTKNHLALGTGVLDLQKYFQLAWELDLRVVLETKTVEGLKQSAAYAAALLKRQG